MTPNMPIPKLPKVKVAPLSAAKEGSWYHGGTYERGAEVNRPLYLSQEPKIADSYVEMYKDRYGHLDPQADVQTKQLRPQVSKTADEKTLMELAARHYDAEYLKDFPPLNYLDANQHDPRAVNALVRDLRELGYDSVAGRDITYNPKPGEPYDAPAMVMLPGTVAKADGGMVNSAPEEALKNTITDPQAFRMLDLDLANLALLNQQPRRMAEGGSVFNPQGSDYDYQTARAYGMGQGDGNWGSVAPASEDDRKLHGLPEDSYLMLKGAQHPTWGKAVEAEAARGSKIVKHGERYYSVPSKAEGGEVSQSELDRMRFELERRSPVIEATPQSAAQRAVGTVGGYLDKAGRFISGALEPIAESHPVRRALVDMFLADPLKNAGTALQDYTKTGREITEDQPYVRSPITGSGQTLRLDPRVLDIAGVAQPVVSGAAKLAGAGAKAAAPFARSTAEMANELYAAGQMPGMVSPNAYVVKPKGGNWLPGSVEKNVELMKGLDADLVDQLGLNPVNAASPHVTNWVDNKLVKYIKNEMGTPGDPVRALADKGTLHVNPDDLFYRMPDEFTDVTPGGMVATARTSGGFPIESASSTYAGRNWEASADMAVKPLDIENLNKVFREPWMDKLPSDSKIYATQPGVLNKLGFEHLVDELKSATGGDVNIPQHLRIDPAKLERMSVPDAVQHVAKINEWRFEQAGKVAVENVAKLPEALPSTDPKFTWRNLNNPEDEALTRGAHEAVGKDMGICIGQTQYVGRAIKGEANHFSLFDDKGHPHVAIEARPSTLDKAIGNMSREQKDSLTAQAKQQIGVDPNDATYILNDEQFNALMSTMDKIYVDTYGAPPPDIFQVKGKANATSVNAKYQDQLKQFLNSQEWGNVKETGGLIDTRNQANLGQKILELNPNTFSTQPVIESIHKTLPRFISKDDLTNFLYSGYARGGSVKKPFTSPKHSSYNIDQMRHELSRQG